ncbi:putative CAAX prenyl protease 1 (A-factor converting enzyme) [Papiliotrema laurentii]|uniref:CAAX prenyl protease n=1 Tax=Papiliotrema laurentii TaxID=5418 RepID=A0AAD9FUR2_PAPLA|nr:putative CAAX prenyl protease 1 (A-factor converting enzyme) [Papiliotrema laurentii]
MSAIVDHLDSVITRLADLADNPNFDYLQLVVLLGWLQTSFEVLLCRRQLGCYKRPAPPPELASHMNKETFDKAQRYGRDKTRFQLLKIVINQLVTWAILRRGVYASLWTSTGDLMSTLGLAQDRTITHSLLWFSAIMLIYAVVGLPLDYYSTFVLEERHGFNKSTKKLWVVDQIKTWILFVVLGFPIIAAFLRIIDWAGKSFVPWLMLFLVVVQLGLQIIYPLFIQPFFNKLTPLPEGELRERVENLAGKLKFPLKHLYVIDGSKRSTHSNAYFFGTPWSKHIVLYDTLIERSTAAEVEAVLGHELGHWYFSHPIKLLGLAQLNLLFMFITFAIFIHNKALFSAFGFDPRLAVSSPTGGPQPIMIGFILFNQVLGPMDTAFTFLANSWTRHFEYQADEFSVKLEKKEDLGKALIKLHIDNLSSPHSDTLYSMYHHSHPTLPERLRAMDAYEAKLIANKQQPEGKKDL